MDVTRLSLAKTAVQRLDALSEFIELWTGVPVGEGGAEASVLRDIAMPDPLRRLYELVGNWSPEGREAISKYCVPLLCHQDCLVQLDRLRVDANGKLIFLHENQGVWDCRTLVEGQDPPVWCFGDQVDEAGNDFRGEKLVCQSLSRFLVTFTLQELTLGARLHVCDDGLDAMFEAEGRDAIPVWLNGEYAYGDRHHFYWWRGVMVASIFGTNFFAANDDTGIEFLQSCRGPIFKVGLIVGDPWSLEIMDDGSARLRFLKADCDEGCTSPPGTFEFEQVMSELRALASDDGHYERNAMFFLHRAGARGAVEGQHLLDHAYVTQIFRRALQAGRPTNPALEQLFLTQWGLSQ